MRRCIRFRKRSTISEIVRMLSASPLSDLVLSSMYLSCANSSASSRATGVGSGNLLFACFRPKRCPVLVSGLWKQSDYLPSC